jgi:hypothetical protein
VELDALLARLRAKLAAGDPDMTADELPAVVDRAEAKRRELLVSQPAAKAGARVLALLPKAAKVYRGSSAMGMMATRGRH